MSYRNTNRLQQAARKKAFTLLELLIVILLLGLLAAIAAPNLFNTLRRAKTDTAKVQVDALIASLDYFRFDVGRYPTEQEGLAVLLTPPSTLENWNGPYLRKSASLVDPWGRPWQYRIPGQLGEFDLFSLGEDGEQGGKGDDSDVTGK